MGTCQDQFAKHCHQGPDAPQDPLKAFPCLELKALLMGFWELLCLKVSALRLKLFLLHLLHLLK